MTKDFVKLAQNVFTHLNDENYDTSLHLLANYIRQHRGESGINDSVIEACMEEMA